MKFEKKLVKSGRVDIEKIELYINGDKVNISDDNMLHVIERKFNDHDIIFSDPGRYAEFTIAESDVYFNSPQFVYKNSQMWINNEEEKIRFGFFINNKDWEIPLGVEVSFSDVHDSSILDCLKEASTRKR